MRNAIEVTIDASGGRDKGKLFVITEMPAMRAEKWALRLLLELMKSGMELPDEIANAGMAGVASLGLPAMGSLPWSVAEPLLDELLQCVEIVPDPKNRQIMRKLIEEDIEEIPTLLKLRVAVFKLHTSFLPAANRSESSQATQAAAGAPVTA